MFKKYHILLLSIIILASTVIGGAYAGPEPEDKTPPPGFRGGMPDMPPLQTGIRHPPLAASAAPLDVPSWSMLTFQSLRDNNDWEIFTASGNGTNQTRVTSNAIQDISPSFIRGATQIAFATNRNGNYEIYTMNANGTTPTRRTSVPADDYDPDWSPDGTKIAFTSERDGNPEVYVMDANGGNQTRLTYSPDYDGTPAWSPDGSKIAFTSYRNGGWRIWVMDASGLNQAQLSSQPYSENPAWSPDGSQIAYDADDDYEHNNGLWVQDLWVMNADGSNQHKLWDSPQSNTSSWARSWSPDGRYIACTLITFISYQGTWYWYSAYLIAYDTTSRTISYLSNNGNDWNPYWQTTDILPPSSSVNPLPTISPVTFTVSWSGIDNGPAGLHHYDVQVRDGIDGAWSHWIAGTSATSAQYSGLSGHTYYFRSRAWDNALNIEAFPMAADALTMVDPLPPHTWLEPLPAYSRGDILLKWKGDDPGGSGIQSYDVQVRDGLTGTWTGIFTNTINLVGYYSGIPGHTYYFRIRGTDRAQNRSEWGSPDSETHTTLYSWEISGYVRDNTGVPVSGAVLTTSLSTSGSVNSDIDGSYSARIMEAATAYQVSWAKEGYSSLAATNFEHQADLKRDVVLSPKTNFVKNWDFEHGSFGIGDWSAPGVITTVVTSTHVHTGSYAALLGQPPKFNRATVFGPDDGLIGWYGFAATLSPDGELNVIWNYYNNPILSLQYSKRSRDGVWSPPVTISGDSTHAIKTQVVLDHGGNLHVVWKDQEVFGWLYYAWRSANGVWSTPIILTEMIGYTIQLAVDAQGEVSLAYESQEDIFYMRRSSNGGWSNPIRLSGGTRAAGKVQMAIGTNGIVHLVWDEGLPSADIYYAYRTNGGVWSSPLNITSSPEDSGYQRIVVDDNDRVHIVWAEGEVTGFTEIYYIERLMDGEWAVPQNISKDSAMSIYPKFVISSRGTSYAYWAGGAFYQANLYFSERVGAGTWSTPINVTKSPNIGFFPLDAVDGNGVFSTIWGKFLYAGSEFYIYYQRRGLDGSWSSPQYMSTQTSSYTPVTLAYGKDNTLHFVYLDTIFGHRNLFYVNTAPSAQTGNADLSQTITIPITETSPTLSFLYQLNNASQANGTWFNVRISDGLAATTLYTTTQNTSEWTHRWFDLSSWSGKTITLTFSVHEEAGQQPAWAYLDEVTIGAAHPDVWVEKTVSVQAAQPGQTVNYTISYGNRGTVPSAGVRITDTMPAELAFVGASLPPASTAPALVWEVGSLPAGSGPLTIVVTATLSASAPPLSRLTNKIEIAGQTAELEKGNNGAGTDLLVGNLVYLPLVQRR